METTPSHPLKAQRSLVAKLELPPVLRPVFFEAEARNHAPAVLAALALALAALTAGSGAGLVFSWSRR